MCPMWRTLFLGFYYGGLGLEEDIIRKMPMPYRNARRHIQEITEWWAYIRTETFWDSAKRGKQLSSDLQPIIKRVRGLRLIFKVTSLLLQFVSRVVVMLLSYDALKLLFITNFCTPSATHY